MLCKQRLCVIRVLTQELLLLASKNMQDTCNRGYAIFTRSLIGGKFESRLLRNIVFAVEVELDCRLPHYFRRIRSRNFGCTPLLKKFLVYIFKASAP